MKNKSLLILLMLIFTLLVSGNFVFAQTVTPTPTDTPTPTPDATLTPTSTPDNSSQKQALQNQINDLQNKISDLQGQEKTLSSQIAVMDSQINLTKLKIESTKEQITTLTSDIGTASEKIDGLSQSLNNLTKVLMDRIVATYETASIQPIQVLAESDTASNFLSRLNYLQIAQAHDKKLIYDTQQAKVDYANQKQIFEDKKKQLETLQTQLLAYTQQLAEEERAKKDLLVQTQGSEANYQRILAETKAQLASFSNFAQSQGGASILSNQTVCDGWGCYYNQRDSQWGTLALNGTEYSIASDGCLLTSMAMVYTHYGYRDVTPATINSISSNFSGIPAALLKFSVTANGVSSERISADIDSTLNDANHDPVIIGISYDGGLWPDHFLVLISGSGGNYMMNDPFAPNGHNISFRDRYPNVRIVEVDKVSI